MMADTEFETFMRDVDIDGSDDLLSDIRDIIYGDPDSIADVLNTATVEPVIMILDKLALRPTIDRVIKLGIRTTALHHYIINHGLNNKDKISGYSNGYTLVYNARITTKSNNTSTSTLTPISIPEPFATTLHTLSAKCISTISDISLKFCTNIAELNITDNEYVTTCAPFAKSLQILHAKLTTSKFMTHIFLQNKYNMIGDDGLSSCTTIRELYVDNNKFITTCAPFATSLRKLSAKQTSGIRDDGLRLCNNLMHLIINDNRKITTCAPFAKSLRILHAQTVSPPSLMNTIRRIKR